MQTANSWDSLEDEEHGQRIYEFYIVVIIQLIDYWSKDKHVT